MVEDAKEKSSTLSHSERPVHHPPIKKEQSSQKMWKVIAAVLGILVVLSIFTNGFSFGEKSSSVTVLSANQIGERTIDFINTNILTDGTSAVLKEVKESNGLYKLTLELEGKVIDAYTSGDGKLLFPTVVELVSDNQNIAIGQEDGTFTVTNDEVCAQDGKPVIRLYSTTWCPHCKWIKDTFDKVSKEYIAADRIVAYHWELDTKDDTLTSANEGNVPASEVAVFEKANPQGGIPTFVFGCKYVRIGNGYEKERDLTKEEAEFRRIIDALIEETNK